MEREKRGRTTEILAVVLGINLLPAFGPPTWSGLVLYRLHSHVPALSLVLIGAMAAALGRFLFPIAFRRLRSRLSEKTKANLSAFREKLDRKKRSSVIGLALFALSPVPSARCPSSTRFGFIVTRSATHQA